MTGWVKCVMPMREFTQYLIWFGCTGILLFSIALGYLWWVAADFGDAWYIFELILGNSLHPIPFVLFSLPYMVHRSIKYFRNRGMQQSRLFLFKRLGFFTVLPTCVFGFSFLVHQKMNRSEQFNYKWDYLAENVNERFDMLDKMGAKIKGVHYFGRSRDGEVDFSPLRKNHIQEVVLVPYGYQDTYDNPELRFGGRRRNSSISRDSIYKLITDRANSNGMQVIVKPHIWMRTDQGKWRSDIAFESEEDWQLWASNYSKFILHYAELSERIGAPYFCVGTELSSVTKAKPAYWKSLISEVRKIYHGKLFYAANWYEEYEDITFWDHLDYVGVQAYFPISKEHDPTVKDLCKSWERHRVKLKKLSQKVGKPILFSELGYKSTSDAAIEPWEWVDGEAGQRKKLSTETQANCYEAFFQTFWDEPWFAGVLFWQWRGNHTQAGGDKNIDFTPQNKPAQNIIAKWFGQK